MSAIAAATLEARGRAAVRRRHRRRPDRQRQDHHALRGAQPAQRATSARSRRSRTRSSTRCPDVDQIEVNPRAGLTFASGLRTILRSDPDVILVGEIRDEETAADRLPGRHDRPPGAELAARPERRQRDRAAEGHGRRPGPDRDRAQLHRRAAARAPKLCAAAASRTCPTRRELSALGLPAFADDATTSIARPAATGARSPATAGRVGLFEVMPIRGEIRAG